MLRCRSCTATLPFLQCRCHFDQSCAAASEKLQCNIEKAALPESGAFLPLSCGFQAPTFRHPRLGPADFSLERTSYEECPETSPQILSLVQLSKNVSPALFQHILRAEKTMTATEVTGFDAIFSTGFFATFQILGGLSY